MPGADFGSGTAMDVEVLCFKLDNGQKAGRQEEPRGTRECWFLTHRIRHSGDSAQFRVWSRNIIGSHKPGRPVWKG